MISSKKPVDIQHFQLIIGGVLPSDRLYWAALERIFSLSSVLKGTKPLDLRVLADLQLAADVLL